MENKIFGLLGLAARAGKVSYGMDAVIEGIEKHKIKLVIIAEDTSIKTKQKIIDVCSKNNVLYYSLGNIFENSKAIGKVNKAIIGIQDENFAKAIISKLKRR